MYILYKVILDLEVKSLREKYIIRNHFKCRIIRLLLVVYTLRMNE